MTQAPDPEAEFQQAYAQWEATADPVEKAQVDALMRQAHADAEGACAVGDAPGKLHYRPLTYALSAVTPAPSPTPAPSLKAAPLPAGLLRRTPAVSRSGEILGDGPYELFDPKWLLAAAKWLERKPPAPVLQGNPVLLEVPDRVTLGLLGDWGTGNWEPNAPPQLAANALAARGSDITLHLGDEYYAGRTGEEQRFAREWPKGQLHSFALNSNHSMYSGGYPYLNETLSHPTFASQQRVSYFAFYNAHWLFIGLDTAVNASWLDMFLTGKLEPIQLAFLAKLKTQLPGRRIALFTHHNPLKLDGSKTGTLWDDVERALGRLPSLWYYGHLHAGVAYEPVQGCLFRCVGHSAVPYGPARRLQGNDSIAWYESKLAGGRESERCLNGGMLLSFDGAQLRETFFAEDGSDRASFSWDQDMKPG